MYNFLRKFPKRQTYGGFNVIKSLNQIRCISNAEIATALRPFYFIVHPDLFGRYPQERSINEESLKHLSAHLEAIQNHKLISIIPKVLSFYIRNSSPDDIHNNTSGSDTTSSNTTTTTTTLKLVKIPLERNLDAKDVIKKILKICSLSTDYIDKTKNEIKTYKSSGFDYRRRRHSSQQKNSTTADNESETFNEFETEYEIFKMKINRAVQEKTLKPWLEHNLSVALERSNSLEHIRQDVIKLEKSLKTRLKLKDLQYDCGWNIEHCRGCLKSLERLVNMHEMDMKPLTGRTLIFAPISGVSLEGHIMLFTGDVQRNWLDFIRNISKQDEYLKKIPLYESALSQVLRQIRISRRKFMPKAQVVNYAAQLTKVTTSMLDYLTVYSAYPKIWPDSLQQYELVIESEAGPLMVSPTGQFIAPSTCPGSILVDFLTNHMTEASEKADEYKKNKHIEDDLYRKCKEKLKLTALNKDDSIDPSKMIICLEKLINSDLEMANVTLTITHYYSVLTDGTMCIPWDWTLE